MKVHVNLEFTGDLEGSAPFIITKGKQPKIFPLDSGSVDYMLPADALSCCLTDLRIRKMSVALSLFCRK